MQNRQIIIENTLCILKDKICVGINKQLGDNVYYKLSEKILNAIPRAEKSILLEIYMTQYEQFKQENQ
jgi:Ni,Fe-hydrogenase maturation factor